MAPRRLQSQLLLITLIYTAAPAQDKRNKAQAANELGVKANEAKKVDDTITHIE
jgi:hypothetical protein